MSNSLRVFASALRHLSTQDYIDSPSGEVSMTETEIQFIESGINVTKPYKPRKLKTDPYHVMMRRARKLRRPNPVQKSRSKLARKRWVQKNKHALKRRRQFVERIKKTRPKSVTPNPT